jgi:site-specific DNA-methyltransferase (adenine-specific)
MRLKPPFPPIIIYRYSKMAVNRLILGDNLEILKGMEADSVDLIYLDPPFFSNRNYEVIWGDAGEVRSD